MVDWKQLFAFSPIVDPREYGITDVEPERAVAFGFAMTLLFVLSLWVWPGAGKRSRDHPRTIIERSISVLFVTYASVHVLKAGPYAGRLDWPTTLRSIGIFWDPHTTPLAMLLPLLPTVLLFLGPLACAVLVSAKHTSLGKDSLLLVFRELVCAPAVEEVCFRCCVCGLWISAGIDARFVLLISPLCFAVAHMHNFPGAYARAKTSDDKRGVVTKFALQLSFTTLFGIYSGFLLLRTGSIAAPLASHVFCNFNGFPPLELIVGHPTKGHIMRPLLGAGIVLFFITVLPCTNPALFVPSA